MVDCYFFAGMEQEVRKSLCMGLLLVDKLKDLIGLFLLLAPLWSAITYSPYNDMR